MATLATVALNCAKKLSRVNAAGTAITDLETEIKDEIAETITYYNRQPYHLTEVRGVILTTAASTTWYSSVSVASAAGDQTLSGTVDINSILSIDYMREQPGGSGLNEPMEYIPYKQFEELYEGSTPGGEPSHYTRYAGQIGIWPTPNAAVDMYFSAKMKPVVPSSDSDQSVWFDQCKEMIESGALKRVCINYLNDPQRAQAFAALEEGARINLEGEHILKSSSGKLRAHG